MFRSLTRIYSRRESLSVARGEMSTRRALAGDVQSQLLFNVPAIREEEIQFILLLT